MLKGIMQIILLIVFVIINASCKIKYKKKYPDIFWILICIIGGYLIGGM